MASSAFTEESAGEIAQRIGLDFAVERFDLDEYTRLAVMEAEAHSYWDKKTGGE